ncbi:hypothetical protein F4556_000037 [Kitasatospora gansuensis]|uniref:Lipoprotein n=1 Tax=Kitasatospora gansuensis TaxID=258050 RepID=A0A7W7WE90_9ACTN|nr:hypothetical protein [Kitasatospora gansuensis]MBB4944502.1 hypothetical protein [Kitasatospora gansuensis]
MTSYRPGSARLTLATAVLATVLTLTACEPNVVGAEADAAPSTAPASPTAARPADPSTPSAAASSARPGRRTLAEAAVAGGLAAATGDGALTDVPVDPGEMREGMHLVISNYDRAGQTSGRRILFVGVDNVPEEPSKRREHLWRGLIDYALGNGSVGSPAAAKPYPAGPLGGSLECLGLPESANPTDVLCGWVDTSTAAVALFPRTTPADAARLFAAMRADLEH